MKPSRSIFAFSNKRLKLSGMRIRLFMLCGLVFASLSLIAQNNFPILKSIRFNTAGHPQLQWLDPAHQGVYVQRYVLPDGRDYLKVDSLRETLSYTDTLISIRNGRVAYNLAPWIANEGYPLSKHISIALSATYSTCDNRIVCSWTPYVETVYEGTPRWTKSSCQVWGRNLQDSVSGITDTARFQWWASIPDSVISCRVSAPENSPYYQLQIRAINTFGDTASSPYVIIPHQHIEAPLVLQVDSLLLQKDSIQIHYQLRADAVQMSWNLLIQNQTDSISLPVKLSPPYRQICSARLGEAFYDPSKGITHVLLEGKNNCGSITDRSNLLYLLPLSCTQWSTGYHLSWTAPGSLSGIRYQLFRSIADHPFTQIATDLSETAYTDPFNDFQEAPPIGSVKVCYRIEALYPDGSRVLNHNSVCIAPSHQVTMPDAIAPLRNETNPVTGKSRNLFEPVGNSIAGFRLLILDLNGKIIYSGTEPWNGKLNNNANFVLEGSYNYVCKIHFYDGSTKTFSGTLTAVY